LLGKTLKRLEALLAVAALSILAAVITLSFVDWREYSEAASATRHTQQVVNAADGLLAAVIDAETGQRGYLLTGDKKYLEPYAAALSVIPDRLRSLISLTAADSVQAGRVRLLSPLVTEKLDELRQVIEIRESQGIEAAIARVRTDPGKIATDRIRQICAQITGDQYNVLVERSRRTGIHGRRMRLVTTLGSLALFLMLLAAGMMIFKSAGRREKLINEVRASHTRTAEVRDLLQTTLASIGDAVLTTDAEGKVTFVNPAALKLMEFSMPETLGKPVDQVFHIVNDKTREVVESPVAKVLREGAILGLGNHSVLISKSGREIPIDDSGAPIHARDGSTAGVVLAFRDITERKRTHEALQESEERLRLSTEAAQIGLWDRDFVSGRVRWSPHMESLFGISQSAIEPGSEAFYRMVHAEDRAQLRSAISRAVEQQVPFDTEYRFTRPDGETRWIFVRGRPLCDVQGRTAKLAGVAMDITERKRLEEKLRQSQKLESLGVMAGGIAHDFNNLLVGILGNAAILAEEMPPASPLSDVIDNLIQASERAAHLTRQMLAYSGRGRFTIERLNLEAQVQEILALIEASIPKGVRIELNFEPGLPPVEADAGQIQQLIMNLVINGAEAIGTTGGVVSISIALQQVDTGYVRDNLAGESIAPGPYLALEIRDTGIGMDPNLQAKIFDPFFTTKFTGRGLGLAAVQGIVRGHKGALTVDSRPGGGTTFKVLLPSARAQEKAAGPVPSIAEFRGDGTILVVDDEELVQRTVQTALERFGYTVITADSGEHAIRLLSERPDEVALVLLDMTMPVMSGDETLRRLLAIRPAIPVIATTGYDELEAMRRFGPDIRGFIQKPYIPRKLAEQIRSILGR
jgi:PAS domain S-box-containing protein